MNNKGMAISSILYIILVLFIALLYGVLGLITSGQKAFNKAKEDVEKSLNEDIKETQKPTISYSVSGNTAKIYFSDDGLVSYYAILETNTLPSSWIDIKPSSKYELDYTIASGKTYYIFVRDDDGNVTTLSFSS